MKLQFTVSNQHIEVKTPSKVVADSKNYLEASFFFVTSEWEGLDKTVVFSNQYRTYSVILEGNSCLVPWECIVAGELSVSVFGGDRVTTDVAKVRIFPSGYKLGETPRDPTPDVYAEILDRLRTLQAGTVSQADIEKAVASYLSENPVETLSEEDVERIVGDVLKENPPKADDSQILSAVQSYMEGHADDFIGEKGDPGEEGPQGPQGEPGKDGEDAVVMLSSSVPADGVLKSGTVYDLGNVGSGSTFTLSFTETEGVEEVCAAVFVASGDGEVPLFNTSEDNDVLVPRTLLSIVQGERYRVEFRKSDKILRVM